MTQGDWTRCLTRDRSACATRHSGVNTKKQTTPCQSSAGAQWAQSGGKHAPQPPPPPRSAARAAQQRRASRRSSEAACAANNHRPASRGESGRRVGENSYCTRTVRRGCAVGHPEARSTLCVTPRVHAADLFRGRGLQLNCSSTAPQVPAPHAQRRSLANHTRPRPRATAARVRGRSGECGECQSHAAQPPTFPRAPSETSLPGGASQGSRLPSGCWAQPRGPAQARGLTRRARSRSGGLPNLVGGAAA